MKKSKKEKDQDKLRDSVNLKIKEILESTSPQKPTELAKIYLSSDATSPIPSLSAFELEMRKVLKKVASSKKVAPQKLKSIEDDFWKFWEGISEEMRDRIAKSTMRKLKTNYDKKAIDKIIEALVDFDNFLNRKIVKMVNNEGNKRFKIFKKNYRNVLNATDFLLKRAEISNSEKKSVQMIQSRYQNQLERLEQYRKVTLDPIKEAKLNMAATPTVLTHSDPEGWITEFYWQCNAKIVFVKPQGRPKKIIFNALVVVIYRLLEDLKSKDTLLRLKGKRYELVADIVNQCFSLTGKNELTTKKVENVLHST